MAKALSNIRYIDPEDEDAQVQEFRVGDDVPDNVMESLQGADWAVEDAHPTAAGDVFEIAPGVSTSATEEEQESEEFQEAVESIRRKPTNASSLEPALGKSAGTDADTAALITTNQRAVEERHKVVVDRVREAEEKREPVGAKVAGLPVRARAAAVGGPEGFRKSSAKGGAKGGARGKGASLIPDSGKQD